MLSRCCPCLGRKAVEAFEQAADKKFGKPSGADKETKGLLDTYGLDEDIEEAGEEGARADGWDGRVEHVPHARPACITRGHSRHSSALA